MHFGVLGVCQRLYIYVPVSLGLINVMSWFGDSKLIETFSWSVCSQMIRHDDLPCLQMLRSQEGSKRLEELTDRLRSVVRQLVLQYTIRYSTAIHKPKRHMPCRRFRLRYGSLQLRITVRLYEYVQVAVSSFWKSARNVPRDKLEVYQLPEIFVLGVGAYPTACSSALATFSYSHVHVAYHVRPVIFSSHRVVHSPFTRMFCQCWVVRVI